MTMETWSSNNNNKKKKGEEQRRAHDNINNSGNNHTHCVTAQEIAHNMINAAQTGKNICTSRQTRLLLLAPLGERNEELLCAQPDGDCNDIFGRRRRIPVFSFCNYFCGKFKKKICKLNFSTFKYFKLFRFRLLFIFVFFSNMFEQL